MQRKWQKSLSIHWLLTSKLGFLLFQHQLYTFEGWLAYIQWILFFHIIFYVVNIKSLFYCRFPEDGPDLPYSFSALAMRPIAFEAQRIWSNMDAKKLTNWASTMGIPSHIAGRKEQKQRKLLHLHSDWPCKMPRRMAKVKGCHSCWKVPKGQEQWFVVTHTKISWRWLSCDDIT